MFEWLTTGAMEIVDFGLDDLASMRNALDRYPDRDEDFADASMLSPAGKTQTNLVATTDFNDFETYRRANKKAFKILIER